MGVLLGTTEGISRVVVGYEPEGSKAAELASKVGECLVRPVSPAVDTGKGAS